MMFVALSAFLLGLNLEDECLDNEWDDHLQHNQCDDDETHEVDPHKPISFNLRGKPFL